MTHYKYTVLTTSNSFATIVRLLSGSQSISSALHRALQDRHVYCGSRLLIVGVGGHIISPINFDNRDVILKPALELGLGTDFLGWLEGSIPITSVQQIDSKKLRRE